jgi:Ca2+-binding RTX toxin-like protein
VAREKRRGNARLGVLAGTAAAAVAAVLALPGVASAWVTSSVNNGVLTVTSDAGDPIDIAVDAGNVKINGGNPSGGPDVPASTITSMDVTGGPDGNDIDLSGVNSAAFTSLTDVSVDGGGGNDTINGSQLADVLHGDAGNDRIIGDDNPTATRDQSFGDAGDDTLVWNPGDDDDRGEGGDGTDTIEVNGGGDETFTVAPSATPGRVSFERPSNPFNLDIGTSEKLDLNAGSGVDNVTSQDGLNGLGFALDIDGGPGNDVLDGGDGADVIHGGADNDRIIGDDNPTGTRDQSFGDAGDDTLVWNPGDDDDRGEGGDGTDTIEVNGGAGPEVFELKPSAIPGRVSFDRTGPTPPGPFNLDIGSSERLDLNANGGDDSLNAAGPVSGLAGWTVDADGGDGNDTLAGGSDAIDVLTGGAGADSLLTRDQTADTVTCGSEVDSVTADAQDSVNADCENVDRGQAQQAQSPPAAGAQDTVAPAIKVSKKVVSVNRRRIGSIRITCPASEPSGCAVTVLLRRNGHTLGRERIAIAGGHSKLAKVKLTGKAFALLKKRGSLKAKAVVTALDNAGNRRHLTVALTLKPAKQKG